MCTWFAKARWLRDGVRCGGNPGTWSGRPAERAGPTSLVRDLADQVEQLPGAARGPVVDQRGGATVVRGDDLPVDLGLDEAGGVRVELEREPLPVTRHR